jgi:hypothetical protein
MTRLKKNECGDLKSISSYYNWLILSHSTANPLQTTPVSEEEENEW